MEKKEIEYFNDGPSIVACVNRGYAGMFSGRVGMKASSEWRFIIPNSLEWDSKHRNIYEAYHDYERCTEEIITALPTLPPIPEFKRPKWWEHFAPGKPILVKDFPQISGHIQKSDNKRLTVFFILSEDLWETYRGDGTFLYFHHQVFLSEEEANTVIEENNIGEPIQMLNELNRGTYYYLKKCTLLIDGKEITSPDWMPENPEHYKLEEIIAEVEKLLSGKS